MAALLISSDFLIIVLHEFELQPLHAITAIVSLDNHFFSFEAPCENVVIAIIAKSDDGRYKFFYNFDDIYRTTIAVYICITTIN